MTGFRCSLLWRICLFCLLLPACTTAQLRLPHPASTYLLSGAPHDASLPRCAQLFVAVESAVVEAGVPDVQAQRIAGFPYLRTNRFLASFDDELTDTEKTAYWGQALRQLDQSGRLIELGNLREADKLASRYGLENRHALGAALETCGGLLLAADLADADRVQLIISRASVPDSYSKLARIVGVYPISSWFVRQGITRLQSGILERFANATSLEGAVRYMPSVAGKLSSAELAALLNEGTANPLRMLSLPQSSLDLLFAHFAPIWEIETRGTADRIGSPFWARQDGAQAGGAQAGGVLAGRALAGGALAGGAQAGGAQLDYARIDTEEPVAYQLLSHTRFRDQVLPQLNYVIWFPERPLQGPFDLLGGHLDGITLRVTLDLDGTPVMVDAMHNCGCYHMFFPRAQTLQPRPAASAADEPLLIPAQFDVEPQQRLVLHIEADTHYIVGTGYSSEGTERAEGIERAESATQYRLEEFDMLRSLPVADGSSRSLFGSNGLIAGTTRRERWLLWPMGVLEPGAMRQWGHHATAFVGRRHFDDPNLLETYFRYVPD